MANRRSVLEGIADRVADDVASATECLCLEFGFHDLLAYPKPTAFAMKMAWKSPNIAFEINSRIEIVMRHANASVRRDG
jgi:hypothetical protein